MDNDRRYFDIEDNLPPGLGAMGRREFFDRAAKLGLAAALAGLLPGTLAGRTARAQIMPAAPIKDPRIMFPSLFCPAVTTPGAAISAQFDIPEKARAAAARLAPKQGGAPIALELESTAPDHNGANHRLQPASTLAPGAYSLELDVETPSGTTQLTRPGSVWIRESFPEKFTFGILADYHVGDKRGKRVAKKMNFDKLRARVMSELNAQRPEFVIICGDVTYQPGQYAMDYEVWNKEFLNGLDVPAIAAPGNHDVYKLKVGEVWNIEGKDFWTDYVGPLHYTFDFGLLRFVAVNTFDRSPDARDMAKIANVGSKKKLSASAQGGMAPEQYAWLEGALAKSADRITCVFGHHTPLDDMDAVDNVTGETLVDPQDFIKTMQNHGVHRYFYGHKHKVRNDERDALGLICTGTSGSDLGDDNGWGYSLVEVSGDSFSTHYVEVEPHPKKRRKK